MKIFSNAMDKVSSETHFWGFVISCAMTAVMLNMSVIFHTDFLKYFALSVFGLSSAGLYASSCIYHFYKGNKDFGIKKRLRQIDHSMIYVLIAGTYTPICLCLMPKPHGYYFISFIWAIAIVGIIIKVFWMNAPRFISTFFYILMGWTIFFDYKTFLTLPLGFNLLLILGGVFYSIGAVIYVLKRPNFSKEFGFHEFFHVFILIGSVIYFADMFIYIL